MVTHEIRFARDVSNCVAFFHQRLVHDVIRNPQKMETIAFQKSVR